MVTDSKQNIISEFFIPDELKDDIAYCQRSLRDCVKVHQYFTQQCKGLTGHQQAQVKGFLRELEDEMLAIGKDQSGLVQDVTKRLKQFKRKTATERSVKLEDDLANGYVAWMLSTHCELQGTPSYVPRAVSERLTETQLYQKYRLDADRTVVLPDKPRKRPVLQTSLLKPLAERIGDPGQRSKLKSTLTPPGTPVPLPLAPPAIAKTLQTTGSKRKVATEQPAHAKMLRSRSSHTVVPIKQEVTPIKQETVLQAEAQEAENDSEESSPTATIGMQESPAVKRGRCNLRQALSKVKSTQKGSPPTSTSKTNSAAGRNNRPVGGGAAGFPSTAATGQRSPSLSSSESSNSRASTPGTSANAGVGGGGGGVRKHELISDESSNERFLPLHEELPPQQCNIDELGQYGFLKLFGLYTIADSNLLKGRKNERKRRSCYSTERKDFHYGRFDYFEQQLSNMRRQGSNKRVRLLYSATTAEKANKKRKPWPNGGTAPPASTATPILPPTLLPPSPLAPMTVPVIATDASTLPAEVSVAAATLPSAAPVVANDEPLMEPDSKVCFVCNKIAGLIDTLSTCTECRSAYHVHCHVVDVEATGDDGKEEPAIIIAPAPPSSTIDDRDRDAGDENQNHSTVRPLLPLRDNLCPSCFALAKGKEANIKQNDKSRLPL